MLYCKVGQKGLLLYIKVLRLANAHNVELEFSSHQKIYVSVEKFNLLITQKINNYRKKSEEKFVQNWQQQQRERERKNRLRALRLDPAVIMFIHLIFKSNHEK